MLSRWETVSEAPVTRRLAAILAADVVGYSRMIGEDEVGTLAVLRRIWSDLFNPAVASHRGRIVKMMGDGALVEFGSAVDAVQCAIEIQKAMAERNSAESGAKPMNFRVGVNLGDIVIDGNDIFGDGVNVAARLESQAPAGGVLLSDAVHAQVKGKVDLVFADAGEVALKNIEQPVHVWRWGEGGSAAPPIGGAIVKSPRMQKPTIAVLPFQNMSNDPEQEFFADGLVDDILTTLSKLSGVNVIARNSSFAFKGRNVDVRQAGKELGARYVLEGGIRKAGNRIRINVQLIDAETGTHVWAERYDRAIEDIFAVQDEITLILATEMQVNLTEGEQARMRYSSTSNVEAWNYWVQGLAHFRSGVVTKDGVGKARLYWEKALALDPNSAALHAMMAFMHNSDARFGWWDDRAVALAKSKEHLARALELDPSNADAHLFSGMFANLERRFDDSVAEVRLATSLAPGSVDIAAFAAAMLASAGVYDEAITNIEKAIRLSPMLPANFLGIQGQVYRLAGRIEDAIAVFKQYAERSPGFGHADLAIMYQQTGKDAEAKGEIAKIRASRPTFTLRSFAVSQFRVDIARVEADVAALRAAGLPE
jgi:adenylate cyclase